MFTKQYKNLKRSLKKTDRAIIGIGCSFMQGQGAIDEELERLDGWVLEQGRMVLDASLEKKKELAIKHDLPMTETNALDVSEQEYKNSFLNVLCDDLLEGSWTPINFGMQGNGNRASIKQLYYHPELELEKVKEKIVIYCPSGVERFDFALPKLSDHFGFVTMWPHYKSASEKNRKMLWEGYAKTIWSDYHEVIEQLFNAAELVTWCKLNNAKLVVFPGFDLRYNKKYFFDILFAESSKFNNVRLPHKMNLIIENFPWKDVITVDKCDTVIDVLQKKIRGKVDRRNWNYWDYLGKGSPDGLITRCAHPSKSGHRYFAGKLHEELLKRGILNVD